VNNSLKNFTTEKQQANNKRKAIGAYITLQHIKLLQPA
jgi:hypothetical protein